MENKRTFLVKYGPRKFAVEVVETEELKGFEAFQVFFQSVLDCDHQLKLKSQKLATFSYFSSKFNEYVDMYPGCSIPDNVHVINLAFIDPNESPSKNNPHLPSATQKIPLSGPSTAMKNFVQEVLSDVEEQKPKAESDVTVLIVDEEVNLALSQIDQSVYPLEITMQPELPESKDPVGKTSELPVPDTQNEENAGAPADSKNLVPAKKPKLMYPTAIPVWSISVQQQINSGAIAYNPSNFVCEATAFLETLVPYPTPNEYAAFARTLVEKYPLLADESNKHGNVFTAFSLKVSNRMRYERGKKNKNKNVDGKDQKKLKVYNKLDAPGPSDAKKKKTSEGSSKIKAEPLHEKTEVEEATAGKSSDDEMSSDHEMVDGIPLRELLQQLEAPIKDVTVLKSLLERTFQNRRPVIQEAATGASIWNKWVAMKSSDAIIHEHLLADKTVEDFTDNYELMLKKLNKIFGGNLKSLLSSDVMQVRLLAKLEGTLHPKEKTSTQKAITITKPGGLKPDEVAANAPLMLVSVSKTKITQAFLCAEEDVICELRQPACALVLKTLISSYYAFNRNYPSCSAQFYGFLEYCILNQKNHLGNGEYRKFKATYDGAQV